MAKYCSNCGKEVPESEAFCGNCGSALNNTNLSSNSASNNSSSKDSVVAGFVCSIIGFLCCTYVAIPGLILSIQSLQKINRGETSSDKKWMAIIGIILSILGICMMIYNFINPNENITRIVEEWIS